jgi:hypothetical protein
MPPIPPEHARLARINTSSVLKTQQFPRCRFAFAGPGTEVRGCGHPQLQGLKFVTADLCSGCYYREASDAVSAATNIDDQTQFQDPELTAHSRLWDCAYLADSKTTDRFQVREHLPVDTAQPNAQPAIIWKSTANQDLWLDEVHDCRHPTHPQTTRRACTGCPDYLFPRFSPRMSISDARRLLSAPHLINQSGQSLHWWRWPNVQQAFRDLTDKAIEGIQDYPADFKGRGIVIAGGGRYFPSAYVTIRVLREVGCQLPIQLWHLAGEMDDVTRSLVTPWGVTCVDAEAVCRQNGDAFHSTWWKGWQLKPYAILHAPYEQVLYLDADSYPTRNPEFLFDWSGYRQCGAIFWPDIDGSAGLLPPDRPLIFGVPRFQDRPAESGQLVINKRQCWRELNLAWFYNEHAEFTYRAVWGDKDTFPIAWKRLGRDYARMWPTASANPQAVLQFDDAGCVLFQHRATDKFRIGSMQFDSTHQQTQGTQYNASLIREDFCFAVLGELEQALSQGEK